MLEHESNYQKATQKVKMCTGFVGSIVSLDCGETLGTYQGLVSKIDESTQMVSITQAYRNGVKCDVQGITISGSDIKELKIIKNKEEANVVLKEATPSKLLTVSYNSECPSPVKVCSLDTFIFPEENGPNVQNSAPRNGYRKNGYKHTSNGQRISPPNGQRISPPNGQRVSPPNGQKVSPPNGQRISPLNTQRLSPPNVGYNNRQSPANGQYQQRYSPNESNGNRRSPSNMNGKYKARYSPNNFLQERNHTPTYDNGRNAESYTPSKEDQGMRPRLNSANENRIKKPSTPRKIDFRKRSQSRDDCCFSAPTQSCMAEFDFEKNLALFDKKAVFQEIENSGPEIIRANEPKKPLKYRHDENVLETKKSVLQQIKVPNGHGMSQLFVTDTGLVVPGISPDLRSRLFSTAEKFGFTQERQIEMVGRSASEMVLQLLGGPHRLNPNNGHQVPTVVLLCGPHLQGTQAINCARHLSNHNVNVYLVLPNFIKMNKYMEEELKLFAFCDGNRISNLKDLPLGSVDIIINALDNQETPNLKDQVWYKTLVEWANQNRAPVLAMDPPVESNSVRAKWCLSIGLPLNMAMQSSQLYLCDLGFSKKVFAEVGIKYLSPFSHKFTIPLHPKE
ncbi:EDC3 [Mytilus coruscus]|uniref:Enhancer of mRNA-decapping protein 3 n=1 Tax=Mytilus coruscus TaxID=42192 RepID=A0A6J8E1C1_MYTCO|nr:EDC3 [Mytilus coruscus]